MTRLSTYSNSRDNNFNLIRFCAAFGVFVSHCFPLWGFDLQGKSYLLGALCVNVFFIVSGYLVTKSCLDAKSLYNYFWSRILRIFPALLITIIYSVFVIGLLFTSLPLEQYLSHTDIYIYFIKNLTLLIPDIPDQLPGVFESNTYTYSINVPLWTLPYEVSFYIALALFAFITSAKKNVLAFSITCSLLLLLFYGVFTVNSALRTEEYAFFINKHAYRLIAFFLFGVVFYLFRSKIIISHSIMFALVVLVALSTFNRFTYIGITYAVIVYAIFYLAYIPAGIFRAFNRLGDYSYGIYIFGYPTQQAVYATFPDLSFLLYCGISFFITLLIAILSWHWVEKKALSFKKIIN